jgi:Zn-dependent peptidase ImmA (M78 family)/DNA-binding XRE family transcriptional regulator
MDTIINKEMIRWARERGGLFRDELAARLQVDPDTINLWETGEVPIPVTKAKALAKISLIPYALLFADKPPDEMISIPDFRTHRSADIRRPSPELLETIRDAKLKQEWYRDYLLSEDAEPLEYINAFDIHRSPESAAEEMKRIMGINEDEYYRCQNWESAFRYLINHAEDAGITVIVNSTLKSNTHRPLDTEEFRGFVLSDEYAPLVFINGRDAKAAQMFTLMHEIAHLLIGKSGVLDNTLETNPSIPEERWCNQVAADFLTPKDRFLSLWDETIDSGKNIDNLRLKLKVSRLVCIFRAFQLNLISYHEKETLFSEEMERFEYQKKKNKEKEAHPDPYIIRRYKTGRNLALAVISEVQANRMLYRDAFRLLGVKSAESLREFAIRLGH